MSFITDNKELVKLLVEAGLKDINKFAAPPEPEQTQNVTNSDMYKLTQPLLVNLQREIDPLNAPQVESALGTEKSVSDRVKGWFGKSTVTDPLPKDFRTLPDFIDWCSDNNFTWNDKRFAWKNGMNGIPNEAAEYTGLPIDRTNREEITRQPVEKKSYALPQELGEFLTYLRKTESPKNNVVKVMIGKIIEEFNKYVDPSKKIISKVNDKNLSDVVDGFLTPILNVANPNEGIDSYPLFDDPEIKLKLTVNDVKDAGSFMNWLRTMKVKTKNGWVRKISEKKGERRGKWSKGFECVRCFFGVFG
jgi:predicted DNA-binding protein